MYNLISYTNFTLNLVSNFQNYAIKKKSDMYIRTIDLIQIFLHNINIYSLIILMKEYLNILCYYF